MDFGAVLGRIYLEINFLEMLHGEASGLVLKIDTDESNIYAPMVCSVLKGRRVCKFVTQLQELDVKFHHPKPSTNKPRSQAFEINTL